MCVRHAGPPVIDIAILAACAGEGPRSIWSLRSTPGVSRRAGLKSWLAVTMPKMSLMSTPRRSTTRQATADGIPS